MFRDSGQRRIDQEVDNSSNSGITVTCAISHFTKIQEEDTDRM